MYISTEINDSKNFLNLSKFNDNFCWEQNILCLDKSILFISTIKCDHS